MLHMVIIVNESQMVGENLYELRKRSKAISREREEEKSTWAY